MTRTKLVLCILLAAMTTKTMAQIDIWLATETDINEYFESVKDQMECDDTSLTICGSWQDPTDGSVTCVSSPNGICSGWGALQYRTNGMIAIRDGHIKSYRSCSPDINYGKGSQPFKESLVFPNQNYLVYGKTETFEVPETGDYSFYVRYKEFGFLFIDGVLINNGRNGEDTILANWEGEVVGTVDFTGEGLENSATAYQTHGVNLEAGTHTLELYYSYHEDMTNELFTVNWNTPSMPEGDWQIIPAQAFGSTSCPLPPEAEITTVEANGEVLDLEYSSCLKDSVEYTFTGALLNTPEWAEDIVYVWTMGVPDPTIYETTEPVVTHTYASGSSAGFPYVPKLSVHYNDRYQTRKADSPTKITVIDHPDCEEGVVGTKVPVASFSNGRAVAQFRNNLILNNSRNSDMRVAVYSLSGKLLAQKNVRPGVTAEMNMSNLSKGLYLVKAFSGSELIDTQSFVRQ